MFFIFELMLGTSHQGSGTPKDGIINLTVRPISILFENWGVSDILFPKSFDSTNIPPATLPFGNK